MLQTGEGREVGKNFVHFTASKAYERTFQPFLRENIARRFSNFILMLHEEKKCCAMK
jgi:hypothetical protein